MSHNNFQNYKLSTDITRALSSLEYNLPTEVQRKVIPIALKKCDLVVKSQTGSGKTAAFSIPICELIDWEENKPQALVLTPTRELAVQVTEDMTNIGRYKRIKANAIYGKQSFARQKLELKQKNHVVVGTPGRVLDHIQKGTLSLERLNFLVVDEADEMLNMGFIDQVEAIITELPTARVTMLFSATLPPDIESLCRKYMKDPVHIEIQATGLTTEKIDHFLFEVTEEDKLAVLRDLTIVENPDSCIIFGSTQNQVDDLYKDLRRYGYSCERIHGGMTQEDRFSVMNDFKKGRFRYLIATNVAARGIDIDNITHVINYDLPLEKESYVHRTGRTGRAGKTGKAFTLLTPGEQKDLEVIEAYIGFEITKLSVPSKEEVARKRVAFERKNKDQPTFKKDKSANLNKGIMKLYFNGGKKKKIRAVDLVGTISKIPGVTADDIGVITIQETSSFVDILNGKGPIVLRAMKNTTIKGKQLKVHPAKE
ncbi:DEAD/DEAH box helicase [Alkalihalobacterium chitinilyticum]|uniref:ATP-dependent RNA helicase DbpA n=1 Tax=Alkalihalobacterium chitinilyticum TaxID=2980103 RepID=A0ABT5VIG5_9BACI|nr:DEAD/DEAH box helicase [Alkalihalobacterium chitinilyticum]MDE5414537.1 DEAD/DEAH box helicase [Alkalihalobacterium chitinilyticum]